MLPVLTIAVLSLAGQPAAAVQPAQAEPAGMVQLRGAEAGTQGSVLLISPQGVLARIGPSGPAWYAWDRVALVQGAAATDAGAFMDVADRAWRARTRMERGDLVGAEALWDSLAAAYLGQRGPTSAIVAEGLMRCRLARGAQTAAFAPFVSMLHARSERTSDWAPRAPVARDELRDPGPPGSMFYDEATGLAPLMPPIWVDSPATRTIARPSEIDAQNLAGRVADLYVAAAQFEVGLRPTLPARPDDPGLQLVFDIVSARVGDTQERADARAALAARLTIESPAWLEAWCRVAIGRSLLREPERNRVVLGIAEMLHVPARLGAVCPYLTGVALAEAASALAGLDDIAGAVRLRDELAMSQPAHPALMSPSVARLPRAAPTSAKRSPAPIKPSTDPRDEDPKPPETSPADGEPK